MGNGRSWWLNVIMATEAVSVVTNTALTGGVARARVVHDKPGLLSSITAPCAFKTVNSCLGSGSGLRQGRDRVRDDDEKGQHHGADDQHAATAGVGMLTSVPTKGESVVMSTTWTRAKITIYNASGHAVVIKSGPRTGLNAKLITVGATYGVIHFRPAGKVMNDWSINGR